MGGSEPVYLEICARSQGAGGRFVKNHKGNSIKESGCNGAVSRLDVSVDVFQMTGLPV